MKHIIFFYKLQIFDFQLIGQDICTVKSSKTEDCMKAISKILFKYFPDKPKEEDGLFLFYREQASILIQGYQFIDEVVYNEIKKNKEAITK